MERTAQNVKELKTKPEFSNSAVTRQEVHTVSAPGGNRRNCSRCGKPGHMAASCRVSRLVICHKYGKRRHLQRACRGQARDSGQKTRVSQPVRRVQDRCEEEEEEISLYHVRSHDTHRAPPIVVMVRVDDCQIEMELDAGASMSIMSEATFRGLWPGRSLHASDVQLQSYSREPIPVVGCCYVNLGYKGQSVHNVPLIVVAGSGPSLFGRLGSS